MIGQLGVRVVNEYLTPTQEAIVCGYVEFFSEYYSWKSMFHRIQPGDGFIPEPELKHFIAKQWSESIDVDVKEITIVCDGSYQPTREDDTIYITMKWLGAERRHELVVKKIIEDSCWRHTGRWYYIPNPYSYEFV